MARAAEAGGAAAIRANGAADVAAIRAVTSLPLIGLNKLGDPGGVYITPTFASAVGIVEAGADLVALDGTLRPRPDGALLADQIARIHDELGVPVLADVDTLEAGLAAREAGADLVATTLSGYTNGHVRPDRTSSWSGSWPPSWTAQSSPKAGSVRRTTSAPSALRARTPSSSATRSRTRWTSPPGWSVRSQRPERGRGHESDGKVDRRTLLRLALAVPAVGALASCAKPSGNANPVEAVESIKVDGTNRWSSSTSTAGTARRGRRSRSTCIARSSRRRR